MLCFGPRVDHQSKLSAGPHPASISVNKHRYNTPTPRCWLGHAFKCDSQALALLTTGPPPLKMTRACSPSSSSPTWSCRHSIFKKHMRRHLLLSSKYVGSMKTTQAIGKNLYHQFIHWQPHLIQIYASQIQLDCSLDSPHIWPMQPPFTARQDSLCTASCWTLPYS